MSVEQINLMLHIVWLLNEEELISEEECRKAEELIDQTMEE